MKYGMTIPGPQSLVTLITFPSQAKFSPFTNSWSNVSQKWMAEFAWNWGSQKNGPYYYPVLSNCVCGGSIPPSSCTHVLYTSVLRQDTEPQMFQVIRPTPSMVCERVCEWVRGRLNISAIVHECSPLPFSYTLRPKCPLDTKHIQVKWMNCHEMNEHILRSRQWASCKNQSGADLFRSGVSVLAWKKFMSGPVPHVQTACLYSKTHLFDLSEWIWSLNKTLKFIK